MLIKEQANQAQPLLKHHKIQSIKKKQSELKKQIKPQAENLADLQNAAKIKKQQIALAKEYNDNDAIEGLTADLKRIEQDIKRNTSVF